MVSEVGVLWHCGWGCSMVGKVVAVLGDVEVLGEVQSCCVRL